MAFTKITNTELNSRGATTLPNQPTISAAALKQEFDAPAKEIVAPHFNGLIDELEADTAGASIGLQAPSRRTGSTVKAVVDAISQDLTTVEGKLNGVTNAGLLEAIYLKHGHENKALLDTYDQTNEDIEDAVNQKHSHSNKSVIDKWSESEGGAPLYNGQPMLGDMYSSEYDPDSTVKNAGGIKTYVTTGLGTKVDKVDGKGLSTNDFTNTLKTKLDGIEAGAEVNVQADYAQTNTAAEDYIKNKPTLGTSAYKNSTSVVTDSSDLVESGAVKDIVGWGNKNLAILEQGTLNTSTGEEASSTTRVRTQFIPIEKAISYIASSENNGWSIRNGIGYDNNKQFVANNIFPDASTGLFVTENTNVKYVRFIYSHINTSETCSPSDYWYQFEKGSTATAYEPYHASVEETKCDNTVIGTVEGANASKAWSVGEHFISGGQFKEVTQPISNGGAINDSNTVDRPIADCLVYKAGETISIRSVFVGYLTSSSKRIEFSIPLNRKPIISAVAFTGNISVRTIEGYAINNQPVSNYAITLTGFDENSLWIRVTNTDESAFTGLNNTPIAVTIDGTITFS